jgi:DnaJ-domain-containing protein 1
MLYLALGALALWLILRASGRSLFKRREWRLLTGAFAVAALAGAAYAAVREAWVPAAVLLMMGGWLALSTRRPPGAPPPRAGRMSLQDARAILGVPPAATPDDIKAAYVRLMRSVHPDKGGTSGLAAQLNAARDRLLRG